MEQWGLVVNEALANVMRHAYGGATDRPTSSSIVPGTSHFLTQEKPELVNKVVVDFLTKEPVPTVAPMPMSCVTTLPSAPPMSLTASAPVRIAPTIPPTPCTPKASSESS